MQKIVQTVPRLKSKTSCLDDKSLCIYNYVYYVYYVYIIIY